MPVYLNTTRIFTIPREDENDICDNDAYLCDPDMFFDQLPQPFRLIDKIINIICNDAWNHIVENVENRKRLEKEKDVDNLSFTTRLPGEEVIQCICAMGKNQLITANKFGVTIWSIDEESHMVLDKYSEDGMNVYSIMAYNFIENVSLVVIINEDGSARIMSIVYGRIYFIKTFPSSTEDEKPIQVTNISLDDSCGTLCLSFDQIGGDEQWLEVYRINKEAWTKEIGNVSRAYQEYLSVQASEPGDDTALGDNNSNEPVPVLERNSIRATPPLLIMKMKFPDSVAGISNIYQLHKQLDTSGQNIGLGLNHCITKNIIDGRMKTLNLNNEESSHAESHLMRIAHVKYLKTKGSLISEIISDENAAGDTDYAMILVWWSQCQHLFMYGLNKIPSKDPWTKPDAVRSFSCPISACEVSPNCSFISVGLQNGLLIIIEISSGLTRIVRKVSVNPLQTISFLHFQESEQLQLINVIDQKHSMYSLSFNLRDFSDNNVSTLIESYSDADSIVTINRSYDLILSFHRDGAILLRDMFSGTVLLNIKIPLNMTITNPWNPMIAFVGDRYLCIQTKVNETENMDTQSLTLLYKLDLDQFRNVDKFSLPTKESDIKSYIIKEADQYLSKRHGLHNQRQNCLQQCLTNLHQYLHPSIVQQ